ncbi:putative CCR4-associated factor [Dirofilaria immitis]
MHPYILQNHSIWCICILLMQYLKNKYCKYMLIVQGDFNMHLGNKVISHMHPRPGEREGLVKRGQIVTVRRLVRQNHLATTSLMLSKEPIKLLNY